MSGAALDKAALLAERGIGGEEVEIPGFGTIRVRGLTREEVLALQKVKGDPDAAELERRTLALCLVEPKLTEEEVGQWQKVSPAGELEIVSEVIQRLSGLGDKPVKREMQRFR
jgi:hypothetical protein